MERDSARGAIQPGLKILARFGQTGLGFSARAELRPVLKKSHVIETEFQPQSFLVLPLSENSQSSND